MNKTKETSLLKKIIITIAITTIIYIVLLIFSYQIYHRYIWQKQDTIYRLAQLIEANLLSIFIILVIIDIFIIFHLHYQETFPLNNSHFKQHLTNNLLRKIGITVIITAIIYSVLLLYSYQIYHKYIWQEYDIVYQIAQLIKENMLAILITLITADTIIILWLRYTESLQYIEMMLEAGKVLVNDDETLINLPIELKEIEEQMNQIKQESLQNKKAIKEAEKQRNDLLLYLAHDLKTPLTSIIGYLNLITKQPNLTIEEKSQYSQIAYDKAIRLEELIEEFFSIAKYNLTDTELEFSNVNLSIMLAQISYEFMPLYHEKNIECKTFIEDNLNINLDINLFERVLDNLIRNAINYSTSNSKIIIEANKTDDYLFIRITNHVEKIKLDKLERIFEPFVRLDSARNSKTGGSGLGLAITKRIVELHQGTIMVSGVNNYIIFTIKLPL